MEIDYSSVHIARVLLFSKREIHLKSISRFRTYLTVTIVSIRKIKLPMFFRQMMSLCCQKYTKHNKRGKDNCAFLGYYGATSLNFGTTYQSIEDGTDMVSRNLGKKLIFICPCIVI